MADLLLTASGKGGWTGNIGLGYTRTVHLTAEAVEHAYSLGYVIVRPTISTSAYGNRYTVVVTVYDKEERSGTATFSVKFSSANASGYKPEWQISVPDAFDVNAIDRFTIVATDANKTKIFITTATHYVDAAYYLPTAPTPPTQLYCVPDSVASGKAFLYWDGAEAGTHNEIGGYEIYSTTEDPSKDEKYSLAYGDIPPGYMSLPVDSVSGNGSKIYYKVRAIGEIRDISSGLSSVYATLTTEWSDPQAPTGLRFSRSPARPKEEILLLWDVPVPGVNNPADKYEIYSSTNGEYYSSLGTASETRFTVAAAEANDGLIYFKIKSIGTVSSTESELSEPITLLTHYTPVEPPASAPIISGTGVEPETPITLTWEDGFSGENNDVLGYEVWRSVNGREPELLHSFAVNVHSVTVFPPYSNDEAYTFTIKALGQYAGGDSVFSAYSSPLRCYFTAPSTPTGLLLNGKTSEYLDAGDSGLLTWNGSTGGDNNALTGYRIYRNGAPYATVGVGVLELRISAAQNPGSQITWFVRAVGRWSESASSNTIYLSTNLPVAPPRSNERITQFLFFDRDDQLLFIRDDAVSLNVVEQNYSISGSFPLSNEKQITHGMRIGWLEADELKLYEIRQPALDPVSMLISFSGEHVALSELTDTIIEDVRPIDKSADYAAERALDGTAWKLGTVSFPQSVTGTTNFYYASVWEALLNIRDTWGAVISPRLAYTYEGIERYIDVLERRGENRGVRLVLDLNIQSANVTYDDRQTYTALYGRGSSTGDGERLLDFSEVAWNTDDGDPVNKPYGQKWVEDPAATAIYGRAGRPRFGIVKFDTVNAEELLSLTWEALKQYSRPKLTINMTAFDLSTIGYAAQGIALGDDVVVVLDPIGVEVMARVTQFNRDVLQPEMSKATIGDYREDIIAKIATSSTQSGSVAPSPVFDVDRSLTIDGMAANSKTVGDKLAGKLDANVGRENAGKILQADAVGSMQLVDMPAPSGGVTEQKAREIAEDVTGTALQPIQQELARTVKTVNHTAPDAFGNVNVSGGADVRDSGWKKLPMASPWSSDNVIIRRYGRLVQIMSVGDLKASSTISQGAEIYAKIVDIPVGFRPSSYRIEILSRGAGACVWYAVISPTNASPSTYDDGTRGKALNLWRYRNTTSTSYTNFTTGQTGTFNLVYMSDDDFPSAADLAELEDFIPD